MQFVPLDGEGRAPAPARITTGATQFNGLRGFVQVANDSVTLTGSGALARRCLPLLRLHVTALAPLPAEVALLSVSGARVVVQLRCGCCGVPACRLLYPLLPRVSSWSFEARSVARSVARLVLRRAAPDVRAIVDAWFADDHAAIYQAFVDCLPDIEQRAVRCPACEFSADPTLA